MYCSDKLFVCKFNLLTKLGPWMAHRFTLSEWDCKPKPHPKYQRKQDAKKPEAFDGVLTKYIIIPNLSILARSPEFEHYAYTKCVLQKMVIVAYHILHDLI